MKGKGKGDRGSRFQDDCPLQFPSLKLVDHTRLCPRYTTGKQAVLHSKRYEKPRSLTNISTFCVILAFCLIMMRGS